MALDFANQGAVQLAHTLSIECLQEEQERWPIPREVRNDCGTSHYQQVFVLFSKKIAKYGFQFQFELSNSIYDVIIFIRKNQKVEFIFQWEAELRSKKRFQHRFRLRFKGREKLWKERLHTLDMSAGFSRGMRSLSGFLSWFIWMQQQHFWPG